MVVKYGVSGPSGGWTVVKYDNCSTTLENVEFSRVEEKHNESGMRNPGGLKTSRFNAMYIFSTLENVEF